jgi:hypothetical protein
VPHAAEGDVVELGLRPREVVDGEVAQRCDAHRRRTRLAGCAPLAVATGRVGVRDPSIHHEQGETGGGEAQRHHLGCQGAAVEEDRGIRFAEQRRRLIHDAGRGADELVLGELPHAGERGPGEAEAPQVVEREGDGALDGGG